MTKSELIERIAEKQQYMDVKDVKATVNCLINIMSEHLENNRHVEVRGFGSFTIHHYKARKSRNPKTGEPIQLGCSCRVHFKPGLLLRDIVNASVKKSKRKVVNISIKKPKRKVVSKRLKKKKLAI